MSPSPSKRTPAEIMVVGAPRTPWSDLYHEVLGAPWWLDLLGAAGLFSRAFSQCGASGAGSIHAAPAR